MGTYRARLASLTLLVAGAVWALAPASLAQQVGDIPSVDVLPSDSSPTLPNAGQWFIASGAPGDVVGLTARIVNPAPVAQKIDLGIADLEFSESGNPTPLARSTDIGSWGGFEQSAITIGARQTVLAPFVIRIPADAAPGDHIGVVVARSQPQGRGAVGVIKQVAVRLYVTVSGDAQPDFLIEDVKLERDSTLFPRKVTVQVTLRNTGRVRVQPRVTIDGRPAKGSSLLMSRSVEVFTATLPVSWWGGRVRAEVVASSLAGSLAGPTRTTSASTFVFPFVPLSAVALAVLLVLLVRRQLRRRARHYDELRADLRRVERLISDQRTVIDGIPAWSVDPERAIEEAVRKAQRAGDASAAEQLQAKLDELRSHEADPLRAILTEIPRAPRARQDALIRAANTYGAGALGAHQDLIDALPDDVRERFTAQTRPIRSQAAKRSNTRRPSAKKPGGR